MGWQRVHKFSTTVLASGLETTKSLAWMEILTPVEKIQYEKII
jgi:hypothetical protein